MEHSETVQDLQAIDLLQLRVSSSFGQQSNGSGRSRSRSRHWCVFAHYHTRYLQLFAHSEVVSEHWLQHKLCANHLRIQDVNVSKNLLGFEQEAMTSRQAERPPRRFTTMRPRASSCCATSENICVTKFTIIRCTQQGIRNILARIWRQTKP